MTPQAPTRQVARGVLTALCLLLALVTPRASHAAPDDNRRAAELHTEGINLAKQRKFSEAVAKFEASLKLNPHPVTMHNLGRAWEALGDLPQAWDFFARALEQDYEYAKDGREYLNRIGATLARDHTRVTVRVTPSTAKVTFSHPERGPRTFTASPFSTWLRTGTQGVDVSHPEFRGRQESLTLAAGETRELEYVLVPRPRLGFLRVSVNVPNALVLLSGRTLGRSPLEVVPIETGAYQLEVKAAGFKPFVQPLTVVQDTETEVPVTLEADAGYSGAVAEDSDGTPAWVGWAFIGAGTALAGGGLGMFLHGDGQAEDLAARFAPNAGENQTAENKAAYRAAYASDVRPWQIGSAIVFSAAGALALTGVGLLILDPEGETVTAQTPIFIPTLAASRDGLALGGTLRF